MIYMDNAATTLKKPGEVIDAVVEAMTSMGNAGRGANEASLTSARTIYTAREKLCHFFGGDNPSRLVFTNNSTESLNIALKGLLNPGDHVITTVLEHNSVLRPLYQLRENGVELTIIGCDDKGRIDLRDIEAAIRENTRLIVCTNGSNLTGNYIAMEPIGNLAHRHGLLFVADASQTAGVFPIDVKKMQIDVLCFTGHKGMLGPQGTGGLYVGEGVEIRPFKVGGTGVQTFSKSQPEEMPVRLEAGTLNGHGIAGLLAGVEYLEKTGIDRIREREQMLMWKFYNGIKEVPGLTFYGDFEQKERCPIVTFNIGDYDSGEVSDALLVDYGISTRPGGHCAPLMHQAFGTVKQGAVRFSFSHYNTEEEIDEAIRAVIELAREEE